MEHTEPRPSAAVIGAGPAGLAAAHTLVGLGWQVDVYERSQQVGGMARSIALWDETVDAGPHVLVGGDPDAVALWNRIAGATRRLPLRRALLRQSRLIPYPPTITGLLRGLSVPELASAVQSAVQSRILRSRSPDRDARSWFVARYGEQLYDVLLRNYIAKLWGTDGDAIDASYINTVSTANSHTRPRTRQHLEYPVHGLGAAWEQLAREIQPRGRLCLGSSVRSLLVEDRCVVGIDCGTRKGYDVVLTAAPLTSTLRMLPAVPSDVASAASRLRTRHIVLVHLKVRSPASLPFAWVFVDDRTLAVGRITDSRFWQGTPSAGSGILTLEYWCGDGDAVWKEDDHAIARRAETELHASGILANVVVEAAHVLRIANALPVPAVGYGDALQTIDAFMGSFAGLYRIGRHACFELDSTLSAMAQGIATARRADAERRAVRRPASSSSERDPQPNSIVP